MFIHVGLLVLLSKGSSNKFFERMSRDQRVHYPKSVGDLLFRLSPVIASDDIFASSNEGEFQVYTNEETLTNLSRLMSVTLQCMGGIRELFKILHGSKECNLFHHSNKHNPVMKGIKLLDAIKSSFHHANQQLMDSILLTTKSSSLNDLKPSTHLIKSFPNDRMLMKNSWCKLQWAIIASDYSGDSNKWVDIISTLDDHDPAFALELDSEGK
jgi:hypothetical protein